MKRNLLTIIALFAVVLTVIAQDQSVHTSKFKIKKGKIVFNEPQRAKGQTSMVGFAAEPIETVRVAFIGLGMRGPGAVKRFTNIEGVEIKVLCDLHPERVTKAQKILTDAQRPKAAEYSGEEGWKELCRRDDIDLVYIVSFCLAFRGAAGRC